jgi:lipoprotein-anchoring transpeptidase ErfK/SrfK
MRPGTQQTHSTKTKLDPVPKLVVLAATLFLAAGKVLAQEHGQQGEESVARPHSQEAVRRVVVSIPDRKLALIEDGVVVKVFPVAVGAKVTPSPAGEFRIANRLTNPGWYTPGKVVPPGTKENPLGTRWIGLSEKGFGIHGTNAPKSIGKRASHGCIRMRNTDVEELFELVRVGDSVELLGARTDEVAHIFGAGAAPAAAPPAPKPAAPAAPVVAAVGLGNL